jgi:hypothetical protein
MWPMISVRDGFFGNEIGQAVRTSQSIDRLGRGGGGGGGGQVFIFHQAWLGGIRHKYPAAIIPRCQKYDF